MTFHKGYFVQAEARRLEKAKTGHSESLVAPVKPVMSDRWRNTFPCIATARCNANAYHLCEIFAFLLAMSDEEVMEVLAFTMSEPLEWSGDEASPRLARSNAARALPASKSIRAGPPGRFDAFS
ncbi:hypothetical protein [Woodsholea maritima]|uniref:hypothetical protein n=1 Tax=Woodsholea maritima TaxID=240237 RepID=UPI00036C951A|nr:hypothetical protein [Woodsholea maritima]